MYYEERTKIPGTEDMFRFGVSTEAEFISGNVLLRVIAEQGYPARKLIVRYPEDEAHPVMRAAGGALVVHDLVASRAWDDLAKPTHPGGGIPIVDLAAVLPYFARLPHNGSHTR